MGGDGSIRASVTSTGKDDLVKKNFGNGNAKATDAAPMASPLVLAGKTGLLSLKRVDGKTAWVFQEKPPPAAKSPRSKAAEGTKGSGSGSTTRPAMEMTQPMQFNHDAEYGQCVGTLRWSEKDKWPTLRRWPNPSNMPPPQLTGWRDYLEMRLAADDSGTIRIEPPMLDGLSYPLSLVYALQKLRLTPPQPGPLYLLIVGASSKAEERLMRETTYWHELLHFFPGAKLELVFVGPEIAAHDHGKRTEHGPNNRLTARCFHGTLGDLLRAEKHHNAEQTIVVGFNTGFGNASDGMAKGGFALMTGWLPDLLAMLRKGFVCVFTCANDYSDLRGELVIWKNLLHASVILPPAKNPFKAATVVRESNDVDKCEWSCSACYIYAVCGREADAPNTLPTDAAGLEELKKATRKMGRMLAQTQQPSVVP